MSPVSRLTGKGASFIGAMLLLCNCYRSTSGHPPPLMPRATVADHRGLALHWWYEWPEEAEAESRYRSTNSCVRDVP
eukprot:CAMPEP_0182535852 /NCGR_PEP_ID=MMETSP1323-20130603/18813_1 /TAXON_ID=236787 /ORGANISM="Florenciella parvula, Strain RCC1693" /LENGTH=76 /DNA_ID=CAMNT_0024746033 /DNA_START=44 /DNA_END=274 /DNA_ORIENTATION=-